MRDDTIGLALLLFLAACGGSSGGGGGGDPPPEPNEAPVLSAPAGLTGGPVQFSLVLPTGSTDSLTFSATDADGDPLQWTVAVSATGLAATGLSFTSPTAGATQTVDLTAVAAPASASMSVLVEDPNGGVAAIDVLVVRSGAPTLTGVDPHSAFATKRQQVTLTGASFSLSGTVTTLGSFDAVQMGSITVVDDTTLTGTTPQSGSPGARTVAVSNTYGTDALPSSAFTMYAYPVDLLDSDFAFDAAAGSALAAAADGLAMHAVWVEGNAVQHRASADGGATWSAGTTLSGGETCSEPQVFVSGDAVFVAWIGDGTAVHSRASGDAGASFDADVIVNPSAGSTAAERLRIAGSGDRRYCTWLAGNSPKLVTGAASANAGATWTTAAALSDQGTSQRDHAIGCEGAVAWVVYYDSPPGTGSGAYLTRTSTGGSAWTQGVRRSDNSTAITDLCTCHDGARVFLVWSDGGALEYTVSTDTGANWPTLPTALRGTDLGAATATVARCEADRLYTVYVAGGQNVAFSRVGAAGAAPEHVTLSDVVEAAGEPALQVRGNYLFAAWRGGDVGGGSGPARIRLSTSVDLGQTFEAPAVFGDSSATQEKPVLLIDSARLWVGFTDYRGGARLFANTTEL